ncbi:hypothetical protein E4U57_003590 [Claviceps arundinis]|uniref:Sodium/calcium exchanger membrane region domain-containing protein n=1 Tax=Claviceps arundinis TaxID=1623583 RepID=A0A9P7N1A1_9HYPO|nr:hypothetical protein E4U57_003590 [Claviceps arundinis]KAG5977213.1 hypothetical protein E4U56_000177 [Claviceps arundinis]
MKQPRSDPPDIQTQLPGPTQAHRVHHDAVPSPSDHHLSSEKSPAVRRSRRKDKTSRIVETKENHIDLLGADTQNSNPGKDTSPDHDVPGSSLLEEVPEKQQTKRTRLEECRRSFWLIATHSWLNVLLVFVPIGIVVANVKGVHGGIVFAMNCIAVVPLAGLLSHATESVASKMGDSLGALLNVTFGNAVELIIFIIALVKNEIRIVQASLLGSILANLLLILGMGFFLGGLRYREQIYNSTVTQMSACLLSLSVVSLVLPTAFHASFKDSARADAQSLKISRGTSVVLLLVYIIYLMFQLKSHAYMYESTPQHIVDAEATPGPAAAWLDTSSSSDSDSSSSSDSDASDQSRDTIGRKVKKVLRGGRRRKSSATSADLEGKMWPHGSTAPGTGNPSPPEETTSEGSASVTGRKNGLVGLLNQDVDTTDDEEERGGRYRKYRRHRRSRRRHRSRRHEEKKNAQQATQGTGNDDVNQAGASSNVRRVDFALPPQTDHAQSSAVASTSATATPGGETTTETGPPKRPLAATFRSISVKTLAPAVFLAQQPPQPPVPTTPTRPVPRVRFGIRRTNSLPDRLGHNPQFRAPGGTYPAQIPLMALNNPTTASHEATDPDSSASEEHLTRTASIILLLASTALVAVCAEFLVDSIKDVTSSSGLGEVFIGLIILPIVGNAAEHVTAVTVAMKNKMDLAIGVAVGSSIQIALFVTPLVVILGWIMDKQMSLYFTLFETVCLFVSAFVVNFLVLDGRSNYLEGALLCAVYVIIAVVAFFFPDDRDANHLGQ